MGGAKRRPRATLRCLSSSAIASIALLVATAAPAIADLPVGDPGIVFVGPTVRALPTELEFLSPSPHLTAGFTCYAASYPGPAGRCQPYLQAMEGPDPSGFYHFRFGLPTAPAEELHIEAISPTPNSFDGDRLRVDLMATTRGIAFGDIRSCLMLGAGGAREAAFELGYYSQGDSTAVIFWRERIGGHWMAPKLKALANYRVGDGSFEPFTRRTLRLRTDGHAVAENRVRLLYFVMRGDHPTLTSRQRARALARAERFSTVSCLPPGGI